MIDEDRVFLFRVDARRLRRDDKTHKKMEKSKEYSEQNEIIKTMIKKYC